MAGTARPRLACEYLGMNSRVWLCKVHNFLTSFYLRLTRLDMPYAMFSSICRRALGGRNEVEEQKVLERQQPVPAHAHAGAGGYAAGRGAHICQFPPREIDQARQNAGG